MYEMSKMAFCFSTKEQVESIFVLFGCLLFPPICISGPMHAYIYIYFLIFLAIDQFTVLCFACAESPRIGPYEYSEAMQLAPEDWRRTGMPNEYPGLENGVR